MLSLFLDAFLDAGVDTLKLIPFLFITYLVMEALERKAGEKSAELIAASGRFGPLIGGMIGIVPQCGFSAAAASLYAGGVISIGTLLSVFLSTSDEMLPLLIANQTAVSTMMKILLSKVLIGALSGLAFDFLLRFTKYKYKTEKRIHDLCEREHCGCDEEEGSILKASLKHTFNIVIFIFIISFFLTALVEGVGEDRITGALMGRPVVGTLLSGLLGLIPNCASSVTITQLYLDGMLGPGQMMAGLLVSAGVGLLVLFRTNNHLRENIKITAVLWCIGVFWGLLIELLGITF